MHRARMRRTVALVGVAVMLAAPVSVTAAIPRFDTSKASMLRGVDSRISVDPIITVGDTIGSYMFDAIPDGISVRPGVNGTVQVFVNHETSTVPFPYNGTAPTEANSQNDFGNSKLSKLIIDRDRATIRAASVVISSNRGFQRFCSNFLATAAQGFNRDLLLTNEEGVDWVNRSGPSWPATEGADNARQAGVAVAFDPKTGESRPIWGMGRHNHENSVAVPGYGGPFVLSGDDTFVNNPSQSQLYAYTARNADAVWNDTGRMLAFVSDDPAKQRYEDFNRGSTDSISGHFIRVPKFIATGRMPDGSDVMGDDAEAFFGTPGAYNVPTDGSFSRPPGSPPTGGVIPSIDGPQWVLERWSQINKVFRFVRLEDMAYDKRPGRSNTIYIVDSGRGAAGALNSSGVDKSTNGRVWRMVLNKTNPLKVASLSIFIEGDDNEVKTVNEVHQPDNIETTRNGIYLTEDPGSSQQFANDAAGLADARRTTARIWQFRFSDSKLRVVARVDQSADEGTTDVDAAPAGNAGAWESSGIVDVSQWFGPGAFLVTVQAHTLWVAKDGPADGVGREGQKWTYKREGGQLVLLRIKNG